jgi:Effector-associated domain 11
MKLSSEQLLLLLSEDRIDALFEALVEAKPEQYDQIILLKSRWHNLQNQEIAGTIDQDDLAVGNAQVRQSLLSIIKTKAGQMPTPNPKAESRLWMFALAGALAIGLISGAYVMFSGKTEEVGGKERPLEDLVQANQEITEPIQLLVDGANEVVFHSESRNVSYEIDVATLMPTDDIEAELNIGIVCHNEDRYPINFWNSSFRLETDAAKLRLSPIGQLNHVVPERTSKEGVVTFAVPQNARDFRLIIQDFDQEKVIRLRRI